MLTSGMMRFAIKKRINGESVDIDPAHFTEPYRKYWQAIVNAHPGDEMTALSAIADEKELKAIVNAQPLHFPSLADIESEIKDTTWFWDLRIPNGKLTVLGGQGGNGKSMVAQYIAHLQIHGLEFPDGTPIHSHGRNVLYVDAEGFASGVKNRANAWGTNKEKFILWTVDREESMFINFLDKAYQGELVERIHYCAPSLVIVDSFGNAKAGGENNVEDVREVLNFLNKVAYDFDIAVILVHHTRKPPAIFDTKGEIDANDFRGSGHIINMARAVLGIWQVQTGPEPNPDDPRILAVLKSNYAKFPKPIGFEILNDANNHPKIFFSEPKKPYREPTKSELCADWILDTLAEWGTPIKPRDFQELAAKSGFTRDTFYSAHRLLEREGRIKDTLGNKNPDNAWVLPDWKGEESDS